MTAQKLYATLKFLDELDQKLDLQEALEAIRDNLNNIVSSPASPQFQSALAIAIERFSSAAAGLAEAINPSQFALIGEMGGREFFEPSIADSVKDSIAKNAMTPSVARDFVKDVASRREQFLETVRETHEGLARLNVTDAEADPDAPNVAFLIPRNIFRNELGTFAKELRFINSLISNLSECIAGQPELVKLQELSSSVPTVAIMTSFAVALAFAEVVNRFLDAWSKIEKIRKVREELREIGATGAAVKELTGQISTTVDEVVEESTKTILQSYTGDQGRKNELSNALTHEIQRLFAQIERGLSVEFHARPKPDEKDDAKRKALEGISALNRQMRFPLVTNEPMLLTDGELVEGPTESIETAKATTARKSTKKSKEVQAEGRDDS